MSTTLRLLSTVAALISSVAATITSPAKGQTWDVNSQHQIQWDIAGLIEPLQLHLAPGGSKDASSYISTLAPSAPNTGKWSWQPSKSMPQHSSYIIIIIDFKGYQQYSPPFQMIGWPQPPAQHTTMMQEPPTYVAPPMYTVAPPMHTSTPPMYVAPPIYTPPPMHESPPANIAPLEPSAVIITSLLVQPIVHTSQPPPIIKTIEKPPIIQTEYVAPIVVTKMQEPVTMIQTRPDILTTEYLQPIVKTILVTETPAPIIKTMPQEPITIIETRAPILLTQSQAPIVKTLTQPPHIMTEYAAPILITSQYTQTIHLTSLVYDTPPPMIYTPTPMVHTPAVVYPPQEYTTLTTIQQMTHTGNAGVTPSVAPYFPNTTSVGEIPTFTTPLVLPVTSPGAASSSGLGGLQPTFVSAASTKSISAGQLICMIAAAALLI